jgi:hypothetical protein
VQERAGGLLQGLEPMGELDPVAWCEAELDPADLSEQSITAPVDRG